jgi:hypothetical protein
MRFKYVQTRQVRYVVIIEAPDMNMADDIIASGGHVGWAKRVTP